ncbi:uncharacterized protein LOC119070739 isoform X2 [Bradysia coprophila]|uniref:uncharacterized protein LOC119070739 isoform X2 n=2 Tax=Bradysia coprophila TaxID=38358 RepID=UPI00187D711A|nr:uncharacterized protein LOC119070739 isoform X2 [Bradysia coprophila]
MSAAMVRVTLYSPGRRLYSFAITKCQENDDIVRSKNGPKILLEHLELLKKKGLEPLTDEEIKVSILLFHSLVVVLDTAFLRCITYTDTDCTNSYIEQTLNPPPQTNQNTVSKPQVQKSTDDVAPEEVDNYVHDDNPQVQQTEDNMPYDSGAIEAKIKLAEWKRNKIKSSAKENSMKNVPLQPAQTKRKAHNLLQVKDVLDDEDLVYDVEHLVLEEVLARPQLYNYKLDLKYRSPDLVAQMFQAISDHIDEHMGLQLDWKHIQNTWKHYYALYLEYSNKTIVPSGSGSNRIPKMPKHYALLTQLDSLNAKRKQISSTSPEGFKLEPPKSKKSKKDDSSIAPFLENANNILAKFQNASDVPAASATTSLASQIEGDPDQAFLLTILPDLRKLSNLEKLKFKEDVYMKLNRLLQSHEGEECED